MQSIRSAIRGLAFWLAAACFALNGSATRAQSSAEAGAAAASAPAAAGDAVVTVLNRPIAVFRSSLFGVPPEVRARRTQRRIDELLERGGAGVVTIDRQPQGHVLMIDGALGLVVAPGDVDGSVGETLESAALRAQEALQRSIAETRESRNHGLLLKSAAWAALATVGAAMLGWSILRLQRTLVAKTTSLVSRRAEAVQVVGAPLLRITWLHGFVRWLVNALVWLALALLAYQWLAFVLSRFAYTRAWGETLGSYFAGVAGQLLLAVAHALPDLLVALLIFLIARGATAVLKPVFDRIEAGYGNFSWLDRDTVAPTRRLVNIGVWLFAIVMAYPYIPGSGSEAFKGMSVLVGLMITLGGSGLVGQAASGLILMYSRTLRVGEYVQVNGQEGTVTELGSFTTKVRTGLGEEITIPNAVVLGTTTKNYSRAVKGAGYVVDTVVTIGYDTPWRQVEAMLVDAARRTDGVLADPPPRVFQTALSDFYVEYRLVCQAIPEQPRPRAEVLNALHANVLDVFNAAGVQIMSPHYLGDPAEPKVVAPDDRFAGPPASR